MEQDGISWTIIAGVLLKHEECPSWRNMQQIWLLLHVIAHSGLLFNKQIEQLYKMSFEIPFSMSRTHLGLPLWCLKSIWLGPILHWMAHMVEKGQLVWHKRDMSEPLAHKVSWLFFLWKKIRKVYLCIFFQKLFFNDFYVKKVFITGKNNVFFFFLWRLHHNSLVLHLFKYLGYNWSMYPMNFVSNEIIRENVP